MATSTLGGVIPIVPTPFTPRGDLDLDGLRRVVDYLVATGVHGLAVLGMASEGWALTDSEREAVISTAAERAAGRVPLVAGCSHSSAHAVAKLAAAAQTAGADALMVMPPAMGSPSIDAVVEYFAAVDEAAEIPVMVQDNPGWTGVNLPPTVYRRLADLDGVRYVKVETRHPPTTMDHIRAAVGDRLALFGGLAGNWLPEELARGVAGTMPASIMPQVYVRVWELWTIGSHKEALATFNRYHPAIRVSGAPTVGIAMAKYLLASIGVISGGHVRSPLRELSPQDRDDVDRICAELDLLAVMRNEVAPDETR